MEIRPRLCREVNFEKNILCRRELLSYRIVLNPERNIRERICAYFRTKKKLIGKLPVDLFIYLFSAYFVNKFIKHRHLKAAG